MGWIVFTGIIASNGLQDTQEYPEFSFVYALHGQHAQLLCQGERAADEFTAFRCQREPESLAISVETILANVTLPFES